MDRRLKYPASRVLSRAAEWGERRRGQHPIVEAKGKAILHEAAAMQFCL
jgi:hypothetical protein